MDSDRILGAGIIIACILAAVLYFGFIYLGFAEEVLLVIVSIAFLLILGIGGWIGWTMASTPSPEPIEDLDVQDTSPEAIEDVDFEESSEESEEEFREKISSIDGMTERRVNALIEGGYDSIDSLKQVDESDLTEVKGIGSTLAKRIKSKYR